MNKALRAFLSLVVAITVVLPGLAQNAVPLSRAQADCDDMSLRALSAQKAQKPSLLTRTPQRASAHARLTAPFNQSFRPMAKPVVKASAALPVIYGSLLMADNLSNTQVGLYQIPTAEGQDFEMIFRGPKAQYGGVESDGIYYATTYQTMLWFTIIDVYGYDLETGENVYSVSGQMTDLAMGLAKDPLSGEIYGIFYNDDATACVLGKIVYAEDAPVRTEVAPLEGEWCAFAIDKNGQFYGIRRTTEGSVDDGTFTCTGSTLCAIDRDTHVVTEIGSTGQYPYYLTDAVFDHRSGRLLWTLSLADGSGYLCEVSTSTGEATPIYQFPNNAQVGGLYIPVQPEDGAPAAVADLKAEFPAGSLSGFVSFTAPATTYDGNAGAGEIDYQVLANGEIAATGRAAYGAEVEAPVTVSVSGQYKIAVSTSNAAGVGPVAKTELFIGYGVPTTPVVSATYADGSISVEWQPVTSTVDGGYIDADDVVYDVVRYPDAVLVAEGTKALSYTEDKEEPNQIENYYFTVVARCGDATSAAGTSNLVILGNASLPYNNDFATDDRFKEFTVIDANADGSTWSAGVGFARCEYNSDNQMDDWLITPPLLMDTENVYVLEFDAHSYANGFPERLEVMLGTLATPDAMTTTLVEPTVVDQAESRHFRVMVTPATTGKNFIGFHGISDPDQFYLVLENISVAVGRSSQSPEQVTDLSVVAATGGELKVNVAFTAPAKLMDGSDCTALTKIEVADGDDVLHTFDAPTPGAQLTCEVGVANSGMHMINVNVYNEYGMNQSSAEVYVGVDYPAAPASAQVIETSDEGVVTVSWDPVTTDVNGNPISPEQLTYTVCVRSGDSLVPTYEGITSTSYTFRAVEEGQQAFVQYGVVAATERGYGEGTTTGMIAAGKPYEEYAESFPNGDVSHDISVEGSIGTSATTCDDTSITGVTAQDGDNGFVATRGTTPNATVNLLLSKIALAGYANPAFVFYTNGIAPANPNLVKFFVKEAATAADYEEILHEPVSTFCKADEWGRVVVNLADYRGKNVEVMIGSEVLNYFFTFFDNIRLVSLPDNDLAVAITGPTGADAGDSYDVAVSVTNEGALTAEAYEVRLLADGEVVETREGTELKFMHTASFTFTRQFSPVDEDAVHYTAEVVLAGDEEPSNNISEELVIAPRPSSLPYVVDLAADYNEAEGSALLTWGEPDFAGASVRLTEDFEDGEMGSTEFADWVFVDVDDSAVGGFQTANIPGIEPGVSKASFFVFDNTYDGFNETFNASSGHKYLAALFRIDDGQADDWAISPEITGKAQTISFFARSYTPEYPENIEVWYSTGSVDPADFVKVMETTSVPASWTEYFVALPEGAKRFAIRSCASASFMLMVDDVTYETDAETADLELLGFNVYRDGAKINDSLVADFEYTDTQLTKDEHIYRVTAVYADGESRGSNEVTIRKSGISSATAGVTITSSRRNIVITGADGQTATVATADGRIVYSGICSATTVIPATQGVYIVKVASTTAKLLVK